MSQILTGDNDHPLDTAVDETYDEPVTLCIAATCTYHGKNSPPGIVLCCDARTTKDYQSSLITTDDSYKIREPAHGVSLLIAGSPSKADELILTLTPALKEYAKSDERNDLDMKELQVALRKAIERRMEEIINEHLALSVGMSFEEFKQSGKDVLSESHHFALWDEIRKLNLEAMLIIATFSSGEAVLLRIDLLGKLTWDNHYSVIGSGTSIAEAFLCQREYNDSMPLMECLYRVYEAKLAAEKNPQVGPTTTFEVLLNNDLGIGKYTITDRCYKTFAKKAHLKKVPALSYETDFLEGAEWL